MIWNIIDATEIQTVEFDGHTGQEGLLHWLQNKVRPYELIITDFEKSLAQGYVFCALVHSAFPENFDYYSYTPVSRDIILKYFLFSCSNFSSRDVKISCRMHWILHKRNQMFPLF